MSSTTTTSTSKRSFMDGKKLWFVLSIVFALIAVVFVLLILQRVTNTVNYYVLGKNVTARSVITAEDLIELTAPVNSVPPTALSKADFLYGRFANSAISRGDILTKSNTSESLAPLTAGLPTNYVAASFRADPSAAAGGNVQTGDYIDLYVGDSSGSTAPAHLFLQHVKVLTATQDLDSATSTTATDNTDGSGNTDTSAASSTTIVPYLFTVGVTPTDAAKIFTASQGNNSIFIALSSEDANNGLVNPVDVGAANTDVSGGTASDAGVGTATSNASTAKTSAEREYALRAEVQRSVAIINAYAQVNNDAGGVSAQTAITAAKYAAPKGYTVTASGNLDSFKVTGSEAIDGDSYGYSYDSTTTQFTENRG